MSAAGKETFVFFGNVQQQARGHVVIDRGLVFCEDYQDIFKQHTCVIVTVDSKNIFQVQDFNVVFGNGLPAWKQGFV